MSLSSAKSSTKKHNGASASEKSTRSLGFWHHLQHATRERNLCVTAKRFLRWRLRWESKVAQLSACPWKHNILTPRLAFTAMSQITKYMARQPRECSKRGNRDGIGLRRWTASQSRSLRKAYYWIILILEKCKKQIHFRTALSAVQ